MRFFFCHFWRKFILSKKNYNFGAKIQIIAKSWFSKNDFVFFFYFSEKSFFFLPFLAQKFILSKEKYFGAKIQRLKKNRYITLQFLFELCIWKTTFLLLLNLDLIITVKLLPHHFPSLSIQTVALTKKVTFLKSGHVPVGNYGLR